VFEHLVAFEPEVRSKKDMDAEFTPAGEATTEQLLHAQYATADWLAEIGAPDDEDITEEQQRNAARDAFAVLTTAQPEQKQQEGLLRLKSPAAIQKLNAMLTAYDWEWIERSKEMRSYAVGKILEETNHIDARVRLRALELLGKVTEIGLFTERVEITKKTMGDKELDDKVREKLESYMKLAGVDIQDVEAKKAEDNEMGTDGT
jgi:hypothetical protein